MGFLAPAAPFISAATSVAAAQQASAIGSTIKPYKIVMHK